MNKFYSPSSTQASAHYPWALITGSAKRLGRAMAINLAQQKHNIIVHYHHDDQATTTLAETIHKLGCRVITTSQDLSQTDKITGWCTNLLQQTGQIDLVINNASIFVDNSIDTIKPEDLYRDINIHAITPLLIAQQLKAYKQPQHIINMLDSNIECINTNYLSYNLSKHMLKQLTLILAKSLAPATRVNAICPGPVLAPSEYDAHYLIKKTAQMPLNTTHTNLEEDNLNAICEAVNYLNKAKQTTGQMVMVDRGKHLL